MGERTETCGYVREAHPTTGGACWGCQPQHALRGLSLILVRHRPVSDPSLLQTLHDPSNEGIEECDVRCMTSLIHVWHRERTVLALCDVTS